MYQALIGVAGACTWLVTARVPSPRFMLETSRKDCVSSPSPSPECRKEHFDVMPWEVPQGKDTIKVMGGYSNPPLGQLAPDKIQSYWGYLLNSEKQGATKSGKAPNLSAIEVLKGDIRAYFSGCRAAIVEEMQKARVFVNALIRMMKEKGMGAETQTLRCTVPNDPDTCVLLGEIVKGAVISLEELSCYNDRLEEVRRAYISKMQEFQQRAKGRYWAVNSAYHKRMDMNTGEWAHMQRTAILEGSQVTPTLSSLLKNPGSRSSGKSEASKPRKVERKLFVEIPDEDPEEQEGSPASSPQNYPGVTKHEGRE